MWDRRWLEDYDDPDLWSDPVRKWMMDWFSPVRRMDRYGKKRGGEAGGGPQLHPPSLLLETGGYLLLETGGHLLLE